MIEAGENLSSGEIGMNYAKEFFDLQLQFAGRVSELGSIPLQAALLDFTSLYVRFVGSRKFDGNSPVWTAYVWQGWGARPICAIGRIAFTVIGRI